MKVLIAEDDRHIRAGLEEILRDVKILQLLFRLRGAIFNDVKEVG